MNEWDKSTESFKLQERHLDLLDLARSRDVSADAQAYIEQVMQAGSKISNPRQREQLRANLRYWSIYVHEKVKGEFQSTDLPPGPPPTLRDRLQNPSAVILFALGALALLFISWALAGALSPEGPPEATLDISQVQTALVSAQPSVTPSPIPTITPTPLPATLTPVLAPTPTPSFAPTSSTLVGLAVVLTDPKEGDYVEPYTDLVGEYQNLQPGWTIHALVIPQSQPENTFLYPIEQSFTVLENRNSGKWIISAFFGPWDYLVDDEEYRIQMVVAIDDTARAALLDPQNVVIGPGKLPELPQGVIPFPEMVKVRRQAYGIAFGEQVVFQVYLRRGEDADLASAALDGSKLTRLTHTDWESEGDPAICPTDPHLIAYSQSIKMIGKKRPDYAMLIRNFQEPDNKFNPIWVEKSASNIYENPVWSPDGHYLAYNVGNVTQGNVLFWEIHVYNTLRQKVELIKLERSARYPTWFDSETLLFSMQVRESATTGIYRYNIRTSQAEVLYDGPEYEVMAALSPEGRRLAFAANTAPEKPTKLYVVELDTRRVTRLTTNDNIDQYPAWSLDGEFIFFESVVGGNGEIWTVRPDGRDLGMVLSYTTNLWWKEPQEASAHHPSVGIMELNFPVKIH